jgi:hypothetical protein
VIISNIIHLRDGSMDDLKEHPAPAPAGGEIDAAAIGSGRGRRRWLRVLLYLLAAVGLLALLTFAYAIYHHNSITPAPERVVIDEATVIDDVMGDAYGKYSAAKKGWVYVDDDDVTYIMRVVQQVKIPDNPTGDEMYFVTSGVAVDGSDRARYGAFHVHPNETRDGNLTAANLQVQYSASVAVQPEQVYFEALSENLWGWVIKTQTGSDPNHSPVTVTNNVLAPHKDSVAILAAFPGSSEYVPAQPCAEVKAAYDAYNSTTPPDLGSHGVDETEMDIEEPEEPLRCDKRRWHYRVGVVNGTIAAPITVTLSGSQDGQAVEARKWKVMFDPKSFTYLVPPDLALSTPPPE